LTSFGPFQQSVKTNPSRPLTKGGVDLAEFGRDQLSRNLVRVDLTEFDRETLIEFNRDRIRLCQDWNPYNIFKN